MAVRTQGLRAAIVGAGLMGRWHADAVGHAGGRVVAVVDPVVARARALARRYRGSRSVLALDEVLGDADVVHVTSPSPTHVELAAAAIHAGRHVLVEKPLAPTVPETRHLLELARARRVLLCPVHQYPFQEGVTRALAERPRLGRLRHVEITMCSAGADGLDEDARDRIAGEILPHPLSLLQRVLPSGVGEAAWAVRHPGAGEIRALAEVDGVTAFVTVSMSARPPVNRMVLFAERATTTVDLFHGYRAVEPGTVSRIHKAARPFTHSATVAGAAAANLARRAARREPAYPGLRMLCARFYDAVRDAGDPPIGAADVMAVALAAQRLLGVIQEAGRQTR